jgi:hypothetical protein
LYGLFRCKRDIHVAARQAIGCSQVVCADDAQRGVLFPLLVPFIGRELERQYVALESEVQAA